MFANLLMVWTQLSERLSQSREGAFEAGLLLRAVKLVISSMKAAATLPDGRCAPPAAARSRARRVRQRVRCLHSAIFRVDLLPAGCQRSAPLRSRWC